MEIHHFSHHHKLSFVEVAKDAEVRCWGCSRFFHGPAYTCKECPEYFFHKSCTELPRHIKNHAFHRTHSLVLYPIDFFVCDGCGEGCYGLVYRCGLCMFTLDVKCATLDQELARSQGAKGAKIKITVSHFCHNHLLTRCISVVYARTKKGEADVVPCLACSQNIDGKLIYSCLFCGFFLHETCLNNIPEQIQSSFHPEHPLLSQPLGRDTAAECGGCGDVVFGISFNCIKCNFYLHVSCAKYQTRFLKHNCHVHPLLFLGKSNIGHSKIVSINCNECGEYCKEAFLGCKKCNFYTHFECVPLPSVAKHIRHLHLLTLTNSVVEDDSGEYLCDICETERNPEHHVYFCRECNFIAHMDCVMSEVEPPESISSYLVPRPKKEKVDRGDHIVDKNLLGGEEGMLKQRKTEHEDSEEKSTLDNLDAEIKQVIKQRDALNIRLWELGKKRYLIVKSIEDREGF